MRQHEVLHIITAIIVLTVVTSFSSLLNKQWQSVPQFLVFSAILVILVVAARKAMAHMLESGVEHRLWTISRWGLPQPAHLKKENSCRNNYLFCCFVLYARRRKAYDSA